MFFSLPSISFSFTFLRFLLTNSSQGGGGLEEGKKGIWNCLWNYILVFLVSSVFLLSFFRLWTVLKRLFFLSLWRKKAKQILRLKRNIWEEKEKKEKGQKQRNMRIFEVKTVSVEQEKTEKKNNASRHPSSCPHILLRTSVIPHGTQVKGRPAGDGDEEKKCWVVWVRRWKCFMLCCVWVCRY